MARLGLGLAAIGRPAYITSGRDRDLPGERSRADLHLLTGVAEAPDRYRAACARRPWS